METPKDKANEPPAPVELDKELVDEAQNEEDDDLLQTTAAMLKGIKDRISIAIAPEGSEDQQAVPPTETSVFWQEIMAKLGELEDMINLGVATMTLKGLSHTAPGSDPTQITTGTPTKSDNEEIEDSKPTKEESSKAKLETIATTAPAGPQDVADSTLEAVEPQPGEIVDQSSDKETGKGPDKSEAKKAKLREKNKARKNRKRAREKANEAAASRTALLARHNPNFAANIRVSQDDEIAAVARVREDIERCEREGNIDKLCIVCDKTGGGYCGGCKKARYCSKKCLVLDLPVHKKVCSDFAGPAADEKRPSPQHHRVLFFPTFRVKPEICWAAYHETDDGRWFEIDHEDITQFLKLVQAPESEKGKSQGFVDFVQFLGDRPIGHMLRAATFNTPRTVGENVNPEILNQSHNAFLKPGYLRPWFGPLLCAADARYPGQNVPPRPRDINARDVHSVARLLELCEGSCITIPELYHGKTISGLLINDLLNPMNVVMGVENVFEMTHVPLAPMDQSDHAIALAFFVGLRWYIRPCHVLGVGGKETSWNDRQLRYASYTCGLRETAEDCGGASTGPYVVVLHGSGNPVEALHMSAFNDYLDKVYRAKKTASKHDFEKYWATYKQLRGPLAANLPSPYKWESAGAIDKLGVYDPVLVMSFVKDRIGDIWDHIAKASDKLERKTFEGGDRRRELQGSRESNPTA
ncbi:uncharacterized protein B0H64DRAFT_470980 [Chaetomium fimeti]|uniref:MYND-type domain-containing protein n=1 Tax=Chaetomium fimeti TaxID=1854472 RepID=A0AAE0HR36_9PEZI|nr:hypothetical protein B0H64DRAFT_470980 [Chaetomium fimeti]